MRKLLLLAILFFLSGLALAQDANLLQQRIDNDQSFITSDQQDIAQKNADIQNIVSDPNTTAIAKTNPSLANDPNYIAAVNASHPSLNAQVNSGT
jgi:hypothetical protein